MSTSSRRFELKQCLGRGSFGEVYAATMQSAGGLKTTVAIKLLRSDINLASVALNRLADEGRVLARLNHPAIVRVYDLIRLNGRLALITELIVGEDLSEVIDAEPTIPARPLLQVMSQIAGALAAALDTVAGEGTLRLVHRDVKPSNIRIDRHGQAKLLDFGIARFDASDREVRTASDLIVGSIPFMAPERFVQRAVEPSSDIFSLGCTLYQGLTGERFYGSHRVATITAMALKPDRYQTHLSERLEQLNAAPAVRDAVASLLQSDAAERPTAAQTARLLEELAEQVSGPTLRMWCRDRAWPRADGLRGSLDGQVLYEGDLEPLPPVEAGQPQLHLHAQETLQPSVVEGPTVLPTLVPSPGDEPAGAATEVLPNDSQAGPPALPEREIKTVLRSPPTEAQPVEVHEPTEDEDLWIAVLLFVGFSAALGVAIFVGFSVFTLLMMV